MVCAHRRAWGRLREKVRSAKRGGKHSIGGQGRRNSAAAVHATQIYCKDPVAAANTWLGKTV